MKREIYTEEHDSFRDAFRKFLEKEVVPHQDEWIRAGIVPREIWKTTGEQGFIAPWMPEEYGGAGADFLYSAVEIEEIARIAETGFALNLHGEIIVPYIAAFGNEEQKKKWLPGCASGDIITAVAMTEPDAGSDVTGAITSAVKDKDEYVINGSKMFITNGDLAKYMNVFCLTDPDHKDRHQRHSFFIVETDRKGFQSNKLHGKLGIRANDTAEVSFSNVRVPASNLVGQLGNGFRELMAFFNLTRLHICAMAVGIARAALEEASNHIKKRRQFGVPLVSFQALQFKIAEMATMIRAARNLYYEAAWLTDNGKMDHAVTAMAKWFSGQVAVKCADEALQMHGGYGYIDEYKVQRIYRDAKIVEIYEGTKEIEKTIVAKNVLRI